MIIISKATALARGLPRYFTGRPCRRGHIAERYTLSLACVECKTLHSRSYYNDNKEHIDRQTNERGKQRRRENPEHERALQRQRYAKNPQRANKYMQEWKIKNPGKKSIYARKCEARRKGAPGAYTVDDILDIKKQQKDRCAYCTVSIRAAFHIDHIIAIARGGSNDRKNIQLLCAKCNRSKHARDPINFARSIGRLL